MLSLCLDTCTERGVVAIHDGLTLLYHELLPFGLHNSTSLMPSVAKGLAQLGAEPHQLNLIVVAAGPGSYTGIRVGVAAAKMMAFAHQIPLVAVSTLHGLVPEIDGPYAAVIDAKVGGAYYLMGQKTGDTLVHLTDPALLTIEELCRELSQVKYIVTPVKGALQQRMGSADTWIWTESAPDATQMVKVALKRFHGGHQRTDGHVDILYLRKSQAEIDREK